MLDGSQLILGNSVPGAAPESKLQSVFQPSARHSFCHDVEGWGPISSLRSDLTPCFIDAGVALVALFGLVFGGGAIWFLLRKKAQPVKKNWHFYLKLVVLFGLVFSTALQSASQSGIYSWDALGDFQFWTSILTFASLGVILIVQYIEHWHSRQPNGVVLFYWAFFIIVYTVKLRALIVRRVYEEHLAFFVTFTVSLGLAVLEFLLEYLVSKQQSGYNALGEEVEDECPYEYADIFSVLTFSWLTPLMQQGYKSYLTQADLWNLRPQDTTKVTAATLADRWAEELEKEKKRPSLWLVLFKSFGGPYFFGIFIKAISDILSFAQPQLLRLLISFISSYKTDTPEPAIHGVIIALAMFLVSGLQSVTLHQYFERATDTGMRVKSSLTPLIYAKALKLSNEGRASKATGDIVNHMSVDQQRLSDLAQNGGQLVSSPFQIILCMLSLYQLLGPSMFAGVGVMILMIPLNSSIARWMKRFQISQMKNKDSRTRLMTEILNNIKSIKLYAWSTAFMSKLNTIRGLELDTLRKIGSTTALANFAWNSAPFLVSACTFSIFALTSDRPLTTDIVFPALTLFNLLGFPLALFPLVLTAAVEATVAANRLTDYLTAEELQPDAVTFDNETHLNVGDESVTVSNGAFSWNRYQENHVLQNIDFTARKGELTCILGRVGSGKSSLLQSLLGDLWKSSGDVTLRGEVAYVSQTPWVMNTTIRDNIVFGHRWDAHFYNLTLEACALVDDMKNLPDGDQTEVGERGISLSGGQKARLALARAVYTRADIYVLDDILSAVDQHVGRHIINRVLGKDGILKTKTRILATNTITVLSKADFIVLIQNKTLTETGTYDQLLAKKGEVANLISTTSTGSDDERGSDSGNDDAAGPSTSASTAVDDTADSEATDPSGASARRTSTGTLRPASAASWSVQRKPADEENGGLKTKQAQETSQQGKVKWSVYREYAKESNIPALLFYFFCILASQTASVGGSFWLKIWTEHESYGVGMFIGVYFALGVGSSILVIFQNLVLWIFCSIQASQKLHQRMAFSIFRSPMSFFETTPSGRVLNRFSSDIYRIDEVLPRAFNTLFNNLARLMFTLIVISMSTPAFLVVVLPLGWIYRSYQEYYIRTSRELKRLDSTTKSPIFAHFQETLGGVSTIRAYKQQQRFSLENEWRMDTNLRAYFPSVTANRWLAIRLQFIGSIVILAATLFAVIAVTTGAGSRVSAGMVGLAMSYALQITQYLDAIVRQTVEVETNIVSVERVLEYAALPSEAPEVNPSKRPAVGWPANGGVSFKNYSTRYREGLDLVLRNIDLDIKPREKIGVVGRTGAGKSSLTLALFRIIEPASGNISVDGLDVSTIGLSDLRGRLSIIPQDPAMFEGTLRDNLDPDHVHDDTDIWNALDYARLKEYVTDMDGQLDARIQEGGSNLSQGQRQLVSLARALLTHSNILVLDEATAAVDVETDIMLQRTLRSSIFQDRTIITIAHRINTIIDCDRIAVLDKGEVAEFDSPAELIKRGGMFYELVKESGLLDSEGHVIGQ